MTALSKTLLGLLLCLTSAISNAQTTTSSKPRVFNNYPEQIEIPGSTLKTVLTSKQGETISIALGASLVFTGQVLSNEQKYENLQTVLIRSTEFNNSVLSISQITNEDRTTSFAGRILNQKNADGYEIKIDATGNYRLQKFETGRILPDCSY